MPTPTTSITMPTALTIAGSDCGAGAGIQADIKTFAALKVYGCSAITAITAQNTLGVDGIWPVSVEAVSAQIISVMSDLSVKAIKTGMLYQEQTVEAVLTVLARYPEVPLVVDPVLVATSGDKLLDENGSCLSQSTAFWRLLIRAQIVTPNLDEAAKLLNTTVAKSETEMRDQGYALIERGLQAVLVKGGHLNNGRCMDLLIQNEDSNKNASKITEQEFHSPRIDSNNVHGTGCTLSAAITAGLAKQLPLSSAVSEGKDYISKAIALAKDQRLGAGSGPVEHFF